MDDLKELAVLWDMDGVLMDTGELHYRTWKIALQEYGHAYSHEEFTASFGKNSTSTMRILLGEDADPDYIREIIDRKEILFRERVPGEVVLLPAVREWLAKFRQGGARQAVASSAPCENIEVSVDALNIRPFFDALVSGADLPPKPNPDVFLKAAAQVGVPPARCVVIEDAVHGVEGALIAGMKCIAVTTTQPATALQAAHLVLDDLTELTTDRFLALFRQ